MEQRSMIAAKMNARIVTAPKYEFRFEKRLISLKENR